MFDCVGAHLSEARPLKRTLLAEKQFFETTPPAALYLPGSARAGGGFGLAIRNHFHVWSRVHRSSEPNSSKLNSSARSATALLPSWWLHHLWKSLGTNPSFAAMEREVHLEPPSPVRCQGRISFHRASYAHSEQQPGWGQDSCCPSPHPDGRVSAASSWSLLSFWHRLEEPPSNRQRVLHCLAEVHSLGLRRRSQKPRADMDRVVLEARSQSQAFRATCSTSTKLTLLRTE